MTTLHNEHYSAEKLKSIIDFILGGRKSAPNILPTDGQSRTAYHRYEQKYRHTDWQIKKTDHESLGYTHKGYQLFYRVNKLLPVIPESNIKKILQKIYDNPLYSSNGQQSFYAHVQRLYYGVLKSDIVEFLKSQEAYQLTRPVYRTKVVRPIVESQPMHRWQLDTFTMVPKRPRNDLAASTTPKDPMNANFTNVLTIVDLFSKFAWAIPIRGSSQAEVLRVLRPILRSGAPKYLQTDNGSEFGGGASSKQSAFKDLMSEFGIKHISSASHTPSSQGAVERFNRTIKMKIYGYLTQHNTKVWYKVLPDLVRNYNNSRHGTTTEIPDVIHSVNDPSAQKKQRIAAMAIKTRANRTLMAARREYGGELEVGDHVRVALHTIDTKRRAAELRGQAKSYKVNWSKDIYTVTSKSRKPDNVAPEAYQPQFRVKKVGETAALNIPIPRGDLQPVDTTKIVRVKPKVSGNGRHPAQKGAQSKGGKNVPPPATTAVQRPVTRSVTRVPAPVQPVRRSERERKAPVRYG